MNATPKATADKPSMQQMIALSIDRAETELAALIDQRCADMDWIDEDADVDMATELALNHIRQMKLTHFDAAWKFDNAWFLARAAIVLAAQAFSRPQCAYGLRLAQLVQLFNEAPSFVEHVEESRVK
ncbi:hypothetical protein [Delftia acidovorans]|uniref:hypothetical protein n=1 Tax=Delftia acidovorans TaxID=80866 RepID=UPI002FDDDB66